MRARDLARMVDEIKHRIAKVLNREPVHAVRERIGYLRHPVCLAAKHRGRSNTTVKLAPLANMSRHRKSPYMLMPLQGIVANYSRILDD